MPFFKCCSCILFVCFSLTAGQSGVRADGFVLGRDGKYVPEKEQLAFIDWDDGHERLSVATRTEASDGPALWIVPIPANPKDVRAEPVATFRHVQYTRSTLKKARETLRNFIELTVLLDTSGLFCPMALGKSASATFSQVGDVEVHQRVEKLGMVVELLTAKTTDGLDRYLKDRLPGVRSTGIAALRPYLNRDFTLACAWPSTGDQARSARALDIEFPFPTVFYPLQASQVYESEIATNIFVRGWVHADDQMVMPGLRCRYVFGQVSDVDLKYALDNKMDPSLPNRQQTSLDVTLTQVQLHANPRYWTQDLILQPGAPAAVAVAQEIERCGVAGLWVASILLGVVLFACAPLRLFSAGQRRWVDWPWAALVGASIGVSLAASACLFRLWLYFRMAEGLPGLKKRETSHDRYVLGIIAFLGLASATVGAAFSIGPLNTVDIIPILILGLFTSLTLGIVYLALYNTGKKGTVVLWFALVHMSVVVAVGVGLHQWLGKYE